MTSSPPASETHSTPYTYANFGKFQDLLQYEFNGLPGKCFVGDSVGSTATEISLNLMPAGFGMPFLHRHRKHEEIFIVTRGKGQFLIDGETFDVREGSVVRVAPEAARAWRASDKEDLHFVCIQATAGTKSAHLTDDGERAEGEIPWPPNPTR